MVTISLSLGSFRWGIIAASRDLIGDRSLVSPNLRFGSRSDWLHVDGVLKKEWNACWQSYST